MTSTSFDTTVRHRDPASQGLRLIPSRKFVSRPSCRSLMLFRGELRSCTWFEDMEIQNGAQERGKPEGQLCPRSIEFGQEDGTEPKFKYVPSSTSSCLFQQSSRRSSDTTHPTSTWDAQHQCSQSLTLRQYQEPAPAKHCVHASVNSSVDERKNGCITLEIPSLTSRSEVYRAFKTSSTSIPSRASVYGLITTFHCDGFEYLWSCSVGKNTDLALATTEDSDRSWCYDVLAVQRMNKLAGRINSSRGNQKKLELEEHQEDRIVELRRERKVQTEGMWGTLRSINIGRTLFSREPNRGVVEIWKNAESAGTPTEPKIRL
ncbi:hypothetical protein GALMADRAFT_214129 [Galerina marginata CBS 339.88]|uniref:Uncharacterized protein n=1 Tax=Galerina marginata (strain CBS 339.88) TaxID=685588 RepID=A0A067SM67_GALM3|nr:hypothetical protein GALMADRAFT_214129 [Galerina marginata CBS 339.88]